MKNIPRVVCIPDLLRGSRGFPSGFFDLVREPIKQGAALDIGYPPGGKRSHGLESEFSPAMFQHLAGLEAGADNDTRQLHWSKNYYEIHSSAVDYLFRHIPERSVVLSFEIPAWLSHACIERGVDFIDLRPSPLRFGRDLYIALRCSNEELSHRISNHCVSINEFHLEAALLGANLRLHRARLEDERNYQFEDLEHALIFVGQAPYDASLLAQDGRILRCTDFSDQIRELSRGRRFFYKSHPFAKEFGQQEKEELAKITGQNPLPIHQNAYQILSSEDDAAFVGISSGLLQEASWFEKEAHILYRPYVPLIEDPSSSDTSNYHQIHFNKLLAPDFWHQVLAPESPVPYLNALPMVAHNHARETIDQWWDYSKIATWERTMPYESFMRGGGASLRQRIESLEHMHEILRKDISCSGNISPDFCDGIIPKENYIDASEGERRKFSKKKRKPINAAFITTNFRNAENWLPLFESIVIDGGTCGAISLSWTGDDSFRRIKEFSYPVIYSKNIDSLDSNGISKEKIESIINEHVNTDIDAIFICDMQSYPSSYVYQILSKRKNKPLVIGLQHGLFQSWWFYNKNFCADYMFCLGDRHRLELSPALRNRAFPVGLPKLDKLNNKKTHNAGYILYLAQKFSEKDLVTKLLIDIEKETDLPVVVRNHPQYPNLINHKSTLPPPKIENIFVTEADYLEQIANADWVITPHSTGGLEALQLKKPLVLIPNHGLTAWASYPGIANDFTASAVLDALHRARSYHTEVQIFLDSALGGLRFDHTDRALHALYYLLDNNN